MSLWVKRFPDARHIGSSEDPVLWRVSLARELPQHSSPVPRVLAKRAEGRQKNNPVKPTVYQVSHNRGGRPYVSYISFPGIRNKASRSPTSQLKQGVFNFSNNILTDQTSLLQVYRRYK